MTRSPSRRGRALFLCLLLCCSRALSCLPFLCGCVFALRLACAGPWPGCCASRDEILAPSEGRRLALTRVPTPCPPVLRAASRPQGKTGVVDTSSKWKVDPKIYPVDLSDGTKVKAADLPHRPIRLFAHPPEESQPRTVTHAFCAACEAAGASNPALACAVLKQRNAQLAV